MKQVSLRLVPLVIKNSRSDSPSTEPLSIQLSLRNGLSVSLAINPHCAECSHIRTETDSVGAALIQSSPCQRASPRSTVNPIPRPRPEAFPIDLKTSMDPQPTRTLSVAGQPYSLVHPSQSGPLRATTQDARQHLRSRDAGENVFWAAPDGRRVRALARLAP